MTLGKFNIFAIGGGELNQLETLKIDRRIVQATDKACPKALFIPTASEDSVNYCEIFEEVYGKQLGCEVEVLFLIRDTLPNSVIKEKIGRADLIYVGGGNTRKMLKLWRKLNVDQMLFTAAKKGTVLSGLSAGAICWFQYGNSEAIILENKINSKTVRVNGLALVKASLCPHMKREDFRLAEFTKMMRTTPGIGIGLDDNCAIQIKNDQYKIIVSDGEAKAYKLYWHNNKFYKKYLYAEEVFYPLESLLKIENK